MISQYCIYQIYILTDRTLGVRPHKEKINISKEFINKTKER